MKANPSLRRVWTAPPSTRLVQLKVTLQNVRPPIWRRLLVPAGFTLRQLHQVLIAAMGWHGSHLHHFFIRGNFYGKPDLELGPKTIDERRHNLEHVLALGTRSFQYEYDFGDGWVHRIAIEKVEESRGRPLRPVGLAGKRSCPPEDSGGPFGYAELLRKLADPTDPEHQEMKEWAGPYFHPERFDLAEVNAALRRVR